MKIDGVTHLGFVYLSLCVILKLKKCFKKLKAQIGGVFTETAAEHLPLSFAGGPEKQDTILYGKELRSRLVASLQCSNRGTRTWLGDRPGIREGRLWERV